MSNNPIALITGASTGIGKELCYQFAKNNYDLVLVARNESALSALSQDLQLQFNCQCHVLVQDLVEEQAAKKIVSLLKERKIKIDVLVNNAGFGSFGKFIEGDAKNFLDMIKVNISALTELTHLILPDMLQKNKGKILNVASTAAFQAGPSMAVYCATKAFVLSFSEAIAEELTGTGVTVTVLCPGSTRTEFFRRANMENLKLTRSFFAMSPTKVAEIGFKALQKQKRLTVAGLINRVMAFSTRISPRMLTTKIAGKILS